MSRGPDIFLLAIRGTHHAPSIEAARTLHNETAGDPAGVAAARSLGDLSHKVFVPCGPGGGANEILILDQWNDVDGIGQFFANPEVQAKGGLLFKSRDPGVWMSAPGSYHFHLPPPSGKNERYVGVIRGPIRSREAAVAAFRQAQFSGINEARKAGQLAHHLYFPAGPPGQTPNEVLGIDFWFDRDGMLAHYQKPEHQAPLKDLFTGPPATSVWASAPGAWVEW